MIAIGAVVSLHGVRDGGDQRKRRTGSPNWSVRSPDVVAMVGDFRCVVIKLADITICARRTWLLATENYYYLRAVATTWELKYLPDRQNIANCCMSDATVDISKSLISAQKSAHNR